MTRRRGRQLRLVPRECAWCEGPIPDSARSDAKTCSKRCRQAAHRFQRGMALRVASGRPLRLAYADPPYPGKAQLYRGHPDFGGEVDHAELIELLCDQFPDGWALSTSAAALHDILPSCPPAARVAAWFRGERPAPAYAPLSAWEPVIVHGGRAYLSPVDERRLDALVHVARARTTDPRRVIGAKPAAFCWWLFDLLGALPGDELVDLFPGSGGVARAWELYTSAPGRCDVSSLEAQRDASPGDLQRVVAEQHDASPSTVVHLSRLQGGGASDHELRATDAKVLVDREGNHPSLLPPGPQIALCGTVSEPSCGSGRDGSRRG